ncbi:MAG: ribonuclease HII [Anaerolineaceae bacterium]|nr:MAG: ribonuclease HII [Anaerolineaceae bacterium]
MEADIDDIPVLLNEYQSDERSGVANICRQYQSKLSDYQNELKRIDSMKLYDKSRGDYTYICGIDEVGRGPFAGPVVAAAVILPKDCEILYINDSKKLSEKKREELYDEILKNAISYGIGSIPPNKIDEINILQSTFEAMKQAVNNLKVKPDILLIDAVTIPNLSIRQAPIVKGDAKSYSIAAASILAKVTRDRLMVAYDKVFPGYGFADNKGYGSPQHIDAIKRLGPTPIHRMSFIKNYL